MIRSYIYMRPTRRIERYSEEQWADTETRRTILQNARASVTKHGNCEVIIKVMRGRHLEVVARISARSKRP
jgi:hypothetical protein